MSDYNKALELHESMTADALSYTALEREDLRRLLEIGRVEDKRAEKIVEDFRRAGLLVHPAPTKGQGTVRVFRLDTEFGRFVEELLTAQGADAEDTDFAKRVQRLEGVTPGEVFRGIRELFEEKEWVRFRPRSGSGE